MKLLENKVALITGGSRGIGKGIVEVFAAQGAHVAFTYNSSAEAANAMAEELSQNGVKVNNAGITKDNLLMRISEEDFDRVIEVNLKSVFNMTKAVQRTMLKQRHGSIINMSSIVGVQGNAGQTNYAASKAGIIGFSKSVALELGSRNIRCNVIAPGFIETEMTQKLDEATVQTWRDGIPLKRGGTPQDIANTCLYLASDLSSYVTGQVIHVDGGMYT
jgi:3-oxoacyl-[acyl-carrier protein] reductase